MSLGAIIMLGASASSPQEKLVLDAQRAATLDLVDLIQSHTSAKLILSSPDLTWFPQDIHAALEVDVPDQPFHFGEKLAELVQSHELERLMYFGGGSAPLLDNRSMDMIAGLLLNAGRAGGAVARIPSHIVLTNNRHSSDWCCISHVEDAIPTIRAAKRDNSLAWALQETGDYDVRVLAGIRPATSMDLDTPADLAIVRQHPDCPPHLRSALEDTRLDAVPVAQVIEVLKRDGSQVAIIGRVAPLAWHALNQTTRCWLRVFAEERGMVASERIERGEVRSLLGELLKAKGMHGFFKALAEVCEAAIIDSRVLMAHERAEQPPPADRFASDLYWADRIQDGWLKEFTQAAQEAPIPILLGGHTVVAGGLYVMAEIIAA